MKSVSIKFGFVLATVLVVVGLVFALNRQSVAATSPEKISQMAENNNLTAPTLAPVSKPADSQATVKSVKGIEIELKGIGMDGDRFGVDFCFTPPSQADWLIGSSPEDVTLTVGDVTIPYKGFNVLDPKTDGVDYKSDHCSRAFFLLDKEYDLSNVTITINRLVTSVPEQPDCAKVQERLNKNKTGIEIKCKSEPGSFGYEITKKPEKESADKIDKKIRDAFSDIFEGPWVFETGIK
jgi:hypothetical protein